MLILDLWGVSFHAVVVFGLGKDFLFKSALGHCVCKGFFRVYLATILKALVRRTDTFCFFMSMNYVCPLFLFRRHVKRNGGSTRVRTLSK